MQSCEKYSIRGKIPLISLWENCLSEVYGVKNKEKGTARVQGAAFSAGLCAAGAPGGPA